MFGQILLAGPIFGMLGTAIGMIRAFGQLSVGVEQPDTETLAREMSIALYTTLIGVLVSIIGMVIVLVVLYRGKNRRKWFFISSVSISFLVVFMIFPLGLFIGLPVLISVLMKRGEFYDPQDSQSPIR